MPVPFGRGIASKHFCIVDYGSDELNEQARKNWSEHFRRLRTNEAKRDSKKYKDNLYDSYLKTLIRAKLSNHGINTKELKITNELLQLQRLHTTLWRKMTQNRSLGRSQIDQ